MVIYNEFIRLKLVTVSERTIIIDISNVEIESVYLFMSQGGNDSKYTNYQNG